MPAFRPFSSLLRRTLTSTKSYPTNILYASWALINIVAFGGTSLKQHLNRKADEKKLATTRERLNEWQKWYDDTGCHLTEENQTLKDKVACLEGQKCGWDEERAGWWKK